MREMQIFEVGFKSGFTGGYYDKFYVCAKDDLHARSIARRWMERQTEDLDDVVMNEEEQQEYIDEIASLNITRNHHIGPIVLE